MNSKISLDKIDYNINYLITDILLDEHILQRIYDLGLIENTIIKKLYSSTFNDPSAYLIRSSVIAIRNIDAEKIYVRRI